MDAVVCALASPSRTLTLQCYVTDPIQHVSDAQSGSGVQRASGAKPDQGTDEPADKVLPCDPALERQTGIDLSTAPPVTAKGSKGGGKSSESAGDKRGAFDAMRSGTKPAAQAPLLSVGAGGSSGGGMSDSSTPVHAPDYEAPEPARPIRITSGETFADDCRRAAALHTTLAVTEPASATPGVDEKPGIATPEPVPTTLVSDKPWNSYCVLGSHDRAVLWWSDGAAGTVGTLNCTTGEARVLASDLSVPSNVTVASASVSSDVYFLEEGGVWPGDGALYAVSADSHEVIQLVDDLDVSASTHAYVINAHGYAARFSCQTRTTMTLCVFVNTRRCVHQVPVCPPPAFSTVLH